MSNHGAYVVTGIWTGWVPPNDSTTGDLEGSSLHVYNVKVAGSVKFDATEWENDKFINENTIKD